VIRSPSSLSSSTSPWLTRSQKELLSIAWPMASRLIRAAQSQFGVEAHEVFITMVDVRGHAGRTIAVWTMGEEKVSSRLARVGMDRIVPLTIPLTLPEGAAVTADLAPDLSETLAMRPSKTTPVLLVDANDETAFAFLPPTTLIGAS